LATVMFGKKAGIFAGLILAFENLTLVMSRITMNDIFIAFFSVCAFIFAAMYSKKQNLIWIVLTSVFLGLAIASKWTGVYALIIVFAFLFFVMLKNQKSLLPLSFLIIIPEFFYIKDIYPAHFRANTMFKLGYQAFIIMGIASTYTFFRIKLLDKIKKRIFVFIFIFFFFMS